MEQSWDCAFKRGVHLQLMSPGADISVSFAPTGGSKLASFYGFQDNSYLIHVNITHAEPNRGFDVELVKQMDHNNNTWSGFHIRKQTAAQDCHLWKEVVYTSDPTLGNQAVLIKGPSCCFDFLKSTNIMRTCHVWLRRKLIALPPLPSYTM
jgi:hypothetical protein